MYYPEDFTADDIMQFEYDLARWSDEVDGQGQYWTVNALCQIAAAEEADCE